MSNPRQERLKQALANNVEPPQVAGALSEISTTLDLIPDVKPRESHQQQVLAMMMGELPQPKAWHVRLLEWYPLALLLSQVRIINRTLWAVSAIILSIGVVVSLTSPNPDLFTFALVAPVVAAGSVAWIYDDTVRAMLEIEQTTRANARLILLARMTLVFGFNLILALAGSVILAATNSDIFLMPLIVSWLAPMTFLTGLAFFLSIVARDTLLSSSASLLLWVFHLLMVNDSPANVWLHLLSLPGLSDPANRPVLLLSGVALVAVALWIVGIVDNKTGQLS